MTNDEKIKKVKLLLIPLGLGLLSFNRDAVKSDNKDFLEFVNFVNGFYHDITELVVNGVSAYENDL